MEKTDKTINVAEDLIAILHRWMEAVTLRTMDSRRRFIKATGLSMPQFSLLMLLFHGGLRGVHDIAEKMDFTGAAASQLVDRLVQAGLAERTENPEDRRAREVALSAKGHAVIDKLVGEQFRWIGDLVHCLKAEDRALVLKALPVLLEAEKKLSEPGRACAHRLERLPRQYSARKNDSLQLR
jgi:DNA-binding MarR family transcriptional regulator